LVDALAVQALYANLVPILTEAQLNTLIDAFGSLKDATGAPINKTLESALDTLRIILPPENQTVVDPTPVDRDVFYTNLNDSDFRVKLNELTGTAQLTLLSGLSANEIITMAAGNDTQGLAARYALTALNPFVLEGPDYNSFNQDFALERFHPASGTGMVSDNYLIDRANMLARKLWFNTNDQNPYNPSSDVDIHDFSIHQYLKSDTYFEDATSEYKVQQGGLFDNTPRYHFGNDTSETPEGSARQDHLYGGGGDDILQGLEGNDYLEGGTGTDTYIINAGDGTDTVLDTDGLGIT
jgi:Ca2+-binding RTX toxin-like protein